jgi:hypothetical protein
MPAKAMVPVDAPPSLDRSRVARALMTTLQGRLARDKPSSGLAVHHA